MYSHNVLVLSSGMLSTTQNCLILIFSGLAFKLLLGRTQATLSQTLISLTGLFVLSLSLPLWKRHHHWPCICKKLVLWEVLPTREAKACAGLMPLGYGFPLPGEQTLMGQSSSGPELSLTRMPWPAFGWRPGGWPSLAGVGSHCPCSFLSSPLFLCKVCSQLRHPTHYTGIPSISDTQRVLLVSFQLGTNALPSPFQASVLNCSHIYNVCIF